MWKNLGNTYLALAAKTHSCLSSCHHRLGGHAHSLRHPENHYCTAVEAAAAVRAAVGDDGAVFAAHGEMQMAWASKYNI